MATPDMEVIKEIPGYKVILKAVLKSQIQQLVEHLASFTEEESVILTASVSDGTLSHLGSDSGKFFLDDHEDIKSQFLGFCLKRHHRKKQEKEREEREEREEAMRAAANQYAMRSPSGPRFMHRAPRMPSPRQQGLHPISMTRASPGAGPRGPYRHEPYPMASPRRTSLNFEPQGPGIPSGNNVIVKVEPSEGNDTADSDVNSSLTPSRNKPDQDDDNRSNSSSSTLPIDPQEGKLSDVQPPGGLGLDSDLSTAIGDNTSDTDTNVANIKVEAVSEAEMELEITGVEPGRPQVPPPESWAPAMPGGFDQSGATGSAADMQGYKMGFICEECGKVFTTKGNLGRHKAIHTGEAKYHCCGLNFHDKFHFNRHRASKHDGPKNHVCFVCGKDFPTANELRCHNKIHNKGGKYLKCPQCTHLAKGERDLREHLACHTNTKQYRCDVCERAYKFRSSLMKHKKVHQK